VIAEYAPGRTGTSSPPADPADLAEVVCADPDLLALEFDALMAANYPDFADRPDPRPPRRTARLLTRRLPPTGPSLPVRREPPPFADEQADEERAWARQRGPPTATLAGRSSVGGDALTTDRAGPVALHRTRTALHMHEPKSSGRPRTPATTSPAATRPSPALIIHRVGWQLPGASRGDLRLLF
jgi:hypothetical protein